MASVMPTATYPKTYVVNEKEYTVKNAADDTSFQASPFYRSNITVQTYPKILLLGAHEIKVKNASEEASARARFGQS